MRFTLDTPIKIYIYYSNYTATDTWIRYIFSKIKITNEFWVRLVFTFCFFIYVKRVFFSLGKKPFFRLVEMRRFFFIPKWMRHFHPVVFHLKYSLKFSTVWPLDRGFFFNFSRKTRFRVVKIPVVIICFRFTM